MVREDEMVLNYEYDVVIAGYRRAHTHSLNR